MFSSLKKDWWNVGTPAVLRGSSWEVNQPAMLAKVLKALEGIHSAFNKAKYRGKKVSRLT